MRALDLREQYPDKQLYGLRAHSGYDEEDSINELREGQVVKDWEWVYCVYEV